MELLTYLAFFLLGYWVSSQVFSFVIQRAIRKIAREHGIDLEEEVKPKANQIPVLVTDPIDSAILLYDNKNNFMCQGVTLDEVAENLMKNKNVKLAMIVHNNEKFWSVEGKVKKT